MAALIRLALIAIGAIGAGSALETFAAPGPGFFGIGGGGGGPSRRRRRRRALSASDREDLLFLGSLMSKSGVERVAAVMIART